MSIYDSASENGMTIEDEVPLVELHALTWRSSFDNSRSAGDKPTKGDYIYTGGTGQDDPAVLYRIEEARQAGAGWVLLCEVVDEWGPWIGSHDPNARTFQWTWRIKQETP